MTTTFSTVRWPMVCVAAFGYYVLGGLWFQPFTFGARWERALGFVRPAGFHDTALMFVAPGVGCLLACAALAVLLARLGVRRSVDGAGWGLLLAVGFSGAVAMTDAAAPAHPEPLVLGAIAAGYHLVGLGLAGALLGRFGTAQQS